MSAELHDEPHAARRPRRDPLVGAWLALIAVMVAAMILVGGATRLTDSGLSITEWDVLAVKGLVPPMSTEAWAHEFSLYQRTTEYQLQNSGMSLEEFKAIYRWEWGHRFLGKSIGFVFAVPFLLFWITGRLRGRFWPVLGLFALGGIQGAIGWWMVTSGLFSGLDVSPVRLAIHLGVALLILACALSLSASAFGWPRATSTLGAPPLLLGVLIATMFTQMMFGALLAGADAGKAYADWPTIGGEWFPKTYAALEPFARNLVENHAAQQFNHRTLGYLAAGLALALAVFAIRRGKGPARLWAIGAGGLALAQASLGVVVVLNAAPVGLSLLHQSVAVLLWASAILTWHCARWR